MEPMGEFGGVTMRTLTRGANIAFPPGFEISSDMAMSWPFANRQALSSSGIVRWNTKPKGNADNENANKDVKVKAETVSKDAVPAKPASKRGRPAKEKRN